MMNKNHQRKYFMPALLVLAFLVTGVTTLASPPATSDKVISIAEARALPLGTVVTIDGSVTVPSGAFSSSAFDQGFAIQDHTGGIYVSTPDNLGFAPRQQVRVTGTLADTVLPGLLVLVDVTDIKAHGSGPKVQATNSALHISLYSCPSLTKRHIVSLPFSRYPKCRSSYLLGITGHHAVHVSCLVGAHYGS